MIPAVTSSASALAKPFFRYVARPGENDGKCFERYSNYMRPQDTSSEANRIYFQRLAEMTPSEKLQVGVRLWHAGNALQRAGMRRKFPHADDQEIDFQIAITRFGAELARAAWRRS